MNAILTIVKYRFWVVVLASFVVILYDLSRITKLKKEIIGKDRQIIVIETKNQALKSQIQKDKVFYESKIANYKKSLETKPKEITQLREITTKGEDKDETECKNIDDILSDYRSIYKLH
jgi:hypothetical protein